MTAPEQHEGQPLTRRQLREIRNTASTPIVTPEDLRAADAAAAARALDDAARSDAEGSSDSAGSSTAHGDAPADAAPEDPSSAGRPESPAPAVPLARAAEPIDLAPAPAPDASVDLGVNPLTRRQARQQERIRTASVPVITSGMLNAQSSAASTAEREDQPGDVAARTDAAVDSDLEQVTAAPDESEGDDVIEASVIEDSADEATDHDEEHEDGPRDQPAGIVGDAADDDDLDAPASGPVVNPAFGSELLAGDGPAPIAAVTLPPSFDQLIARSSTTTGSQSTTNALILSQTPEGAMMSPVTATGEVLITGTFALPEGLGSQGHAPGTTDGKDVDAVLVDGELPAHSSPTPIAASAAISTVKTTGEIIRPPAPEKGGRLMLALGITIGVLAIALVGVLILAVATGVFS
ncbi:hypothetical protein ACFM35_06380 [Microbacterium sp. P01]|uniref:hypothetical protein n=1 Tax=Microbacterium sp. P01 TaxID=3366261 RepID=UPI0036703F33